VVGGPVLPDPPPEPTQDLYSIVSSPLPLILCFGDSLTAGFRSPTPDDPVPTETPYGRYLEERLYKRARVRISGICGERTDEMVHRFPQELLTHKPTYTVVLGGTNDLGWNIPPATIMHNLRELYEHAIASSAGPIAVSVPSIRGFDEYIQGRYELNTLLMEYCARRNVPYIDLFRATAEPGTGRLDAQYSNDGLHLTEQGYRLLAELLYTEVFQNL
jgi:acyl-CoA thioesterase-1